MKKFRLNQKNKKYVWFLIIISVVLVAVQFLYNKEKFKKYKAGFQDGMKIGRKKIYPLTPEEDLNDYFDFDL